MHNLFGHTRTSFRSLFSCLENFNPTEISALDKLYDYRHNAKNYGDYLDSLKVEEDEKLFVDFWYKGSLMGVRSFIPDVDYLLSNVRKIRNKDCYDKDKALADLYSDSEKSSYFSILSSDFKLRSVAWLIHKKVIPDRKARKLADRLTQPLVKLGYKGKINPGRDLNSVKDRLQLLQTYAELIEESFESYGITDKNPAMIRARLDQATK